jgi:hypothetical protein
MNQEVKQIVLDRTRLEQYADCPFQAYLTMLYEALHAEATKYEVFWWEKNRIAGADPKLVEQIKKSASLSINSRLATVGTQIHDLFKRAFKECEGDMEKVPEWLAENLRTVRPDLNPMAIRHARHMADMMANFHVVPIGCEKQLSVLVRPDLVLAMRYDLLAWGQNSLHIIDWKTGFKRRTSTEVLDSFQAQFGTWMLWQQKEYAEIETVHFWYYETLWGTKAYARFDRDAEHPRLPHLTTNVAITGRVNETVKAFLDNNQECWPLPDKCCWCDMIQFCKLASIEVKQIADDPKLFIDNLVVLDELCARKRKTATEWIKAKGPIEGTKVTYSRKQPSERFTGEFVDRARGPVMTGEDELNGHFK